MAQRIESFEVAVPANTTEAAPFKKDISFRQGVVERVEIVVPTGHAGLTGLQLAQANTQLIPLTKGSWITSDGEVIHWPLENYLNNGNWQAFAYNKDVYAHSFYVRFLVNEVGKQAAITTIPEPSAAIPLLPEELESGGTGGVVSPEPEPEPEPEVPAEEESQPPAEEEPAPPGEEAPEPEEPPALEPEPEPEPAPALEAEEGLTNEPVTEPGETNEAQKLRAEIAKWQAKVKQLSKKIKAQPHARQRQHWIVLRRNALEEIAGLRRLLRQALGLPSKPAAGTGGGAGKGKKGGGRKKLIRPVGKPQEGVGQKGKPSGGAPGGGGGGEAGKAAGPAPEGARNPNHPNAVSTGNACVNGGVGGHRAPKGYHLFCEDGTIWRAPDEVKVSPAAPVRAPAPPAPPPVDNGPEIARLRGEINQLAADIDRLTNFIQAHPNAKQRGQWEAERNQARGSIDAKRSRIQQLGG